jgi:hypothetical protein
MQIIIKRQSSLGALLWLFIAAAACSRAEPATGISGEAPQSSSGRAVLANEPDSKWPRDPLTISNASVAGDTLVVAVEHGGGCATHTYQLVVSRAWMESLPVQVAARVSHDAHGDLCKALIRRDLRFSLAPVAETYRAAYRQQHGTVSIRLAGSSAELLYTF